MFDHHHCRTMDKIPFNCIDIIDGQSHEDNERVNFVYRKHHKVAKMKTKSNLLTDPPEDVQPLNQQYTANNQKTICKSRKHSHPFESNSKCVGGAEHSDGSCKKRPTPTTSFRQDNGRIKLHSVASQMKLAARLIPSLLILLILSISRQHEVKCQSSLAQNQQVTGNLPTVIVRGFLNYRTTVDGTVLLFTPDAGGGQSVAAEPATATPAAGSLLVQPTRVAALSEQPVESTSATILMPVETGDQSPDESGWRPIKPTPPLQTSSTMVRAPQPEQADEARPEPTQREVSDLVASPTVQPEEPIATGALPSRATRPKRPSLGFHGQAIRAGGAINGIRRPGIPQTQTAQEPAAAPPDNGPTMAARQAASSASAKLRSRFKKPPLNGGAGAPVPASSTPPPTTTSGPSDRAGQSSPSPVSLIQSGQEAPAASHQEPKSTNSSSPTVGTDEILIVAAGTTGDDGELPDQQKLMSRSGEQRPASQETPNVLSGGLLTAGAGSPADNFDAFLQGDQAMPPSEQPTEHRPIHASPAHGIGHKRNPNERLTGWLDQHNSHKHVPRTGPKSHYQQHKESLSQQLASNPMLSPSFASNLPSGSPQSSLKATPTPPTANSTEAVTKQPVVGSLGELSPEAGVNSTTGAPLNETMLEPTESQLQLQTLTKTYSTTMTSTRTRLVPLQVKSSTAVHTIVENYVITKVLTAYQTMPVGEFLLPEPLSTKSPFEMFNETPQQLESKDPKGEQPIVAPSNFVPSESSQNQEQPISLQENVKTGNDWLHDFNNLNSNLLQQQSSPTSNSNNQLTALLEQQAQENNQLQAALGSLGNEPLDQLASSLDPASLFADANINIPDLNNPIVLAAAIQNPQLAALILAAQQLQLKQRAAKLAAAGQQQLGQQQALGPQPAPVALQPSYSTIFSTQVRPSVYTVRDTMFTTRLVSFKDGRTVRTRTVSEPGSVVEQVLTTTVTETLPVTLTIRPTGMLTLPSAQGLATAAPSSQATISNALIATQLANLLARRQQQVAQPTGSLMFGGQQAAGGQLSQLAALQQALASRQAQPQQLAALANGQLAKQFQPNLQQLLASMQPAASSANPIGQQQALAAAAGPPSASNKATGEPIAAKPPVSQMMQQAQPVPPPPTPPLMPTGPIVTTITNLQVKTYTVHNAFKTIYRTITSTQLITSTLFPAQRQTQMPSLAG